MEAPLLGAVPALVALVFIGVLLTRAWGRGKAAARDRYALVSGTVDAVVIASVARVLVAPHGMTSWGWAISWGWVAACGAIGVGVAGACLRWRSLPWDAPTRADRAPRPRLRGVLSGAYVAAGAALVVLVS
ncbi:hypothetical protein C1701_00330 [Actinoalloteichus sp. AHMU CJ021]|uniref:Uncharacterized protein n=1 Tax=Actinoalloteichus caeruleus DSM 43889 TaxID=1120930 RepID=A0ABT1JED5_ACTCY|nr:hypothetical protein [Actinoalloteichus caeruleus]AUS77055.1 hypothetical protein C1701_00330 [Actinoalloteichus sp. AHMU CJ021]MCP2330862.1 hypothetical protein [Actinoalloteichus caeruleus DSM 43889]